MSQRLSTSVTFQQLEERVTNLENDITLDFTASGIESALGYIAANRAGDTFSGQVEAASLLAESLACSVTGGGGGILILGSHVSGYTGILEFHKLDGVRNGFVGFNPEAGAMQYGSDTNAGHNFSGGPITLDDANIGIKRNGADPVYLCDANDYLTYNRSADKFVFVIGGVAVASIDASGNMRLKGTLIQSTTP
jgi:hypothetical protein